MRMLRAALAERPKRVWTTSAQATLRWPAEPAAFLASAAASFVTCEGMRFDHAALARIGSSPEIE